MHKFEKLNTNIIAKNVVFYEKIDSTQKEIWRRLDSGNIKNGTLIYANIQTDAIGTHGRKWYTTEKNNIAFSVIVYPNIHINKLDNLTRKIAEIINRIFWETYNIKLQIKEPNDIVVNNKKIGGILTETKLNGDIVKYLVIGIGINTNQRVFGEDIKDIASSIKNEFNINVENEKIIVQICNELEKELLERNVIKK